MKILDFSASKEDGRAASGRALAPDPVTRHRSLTRVSTSFFWGFPCFFEIGRLPLHFPEIGQLCPDNYVLRSDNYVRTTMSHLKKLSGRRPISKITGKIGSTNPCPIFKKIGKNAPISKIFGKNTTKIEIETNRNGKTVSQ